MSILNDPPIGPPSGDDDPTYRSLVLEWRIGLVRWLRENVSAALSRVAVNETDIATNASRLDVLEASADIQTPTLAGAWVNFGAPFQTARYWKDAHGVVHLEGLVKSGVGTIFTLPTGYRPVADNLFAAIAGTPTDVGRIDVTSSGAVSLGSGWGNNTFVQLSGITFLAV